MKRGGPLRRRTPLRPVSERRRASFAELDDFRNAVAKRALWRCEGATPACPPGSHVGHHAHHVVRRSQGGTNDPSNGVWLCASAHRWVHEHPAEARMMGLLDRARAR